MSIDCKPSVCVQVEEKMLRALPNLGFKPTNTLGDELRITIPKLMQFKDRIEAKRDRLLPTIYWTK